MINQYCWTDNTQDENAPELSTLLGRADFFGVPFHVTAIRVKGGYTSEQIAVDPGAKDDLERVFAINGAGPCATVEIPGFAGEFVLVFYPFAE